jgi:hypothetical protein
MRCPVCQRPVPAGERVCSHGKAARPARGSRPARAAAPARKSSPIVIIVVVVLLVAVAGAYWALGRRDSSQDAAPSTGTTRRDPMAGLPAKARDPKAQLGEDQDFYVNVEPGTTRSMSLEADRAMVAAFDVTPTDGSVLAAAIKVQSIVSMSAAEDAALDRVAVEVRRGTTSIVHCEAVAQEQIGLFLKNKGSKTVNVRVRRRWWGLEEQTPEPPMEVHTEEKTLYPGGEFEILIHADRRSKGILEVIPGSGTVSVAMIKLKNGIDISDSEKREAESRLHNFTAPTVSRNEYVHNIGDASYCIIRNRGEKVAVFQIRYHTGLRR